MKYFLALLLLVVSINAVCQKKVLFKSVYKPERVYTTSMKTTSDSQMDFAGNPDKIASIKASTTLPIIVSGINTMEIRATTGKETGTKSIPVELIYEKAETKQTMNGKEVLKNDIIAGMIIRGHYNKANKLEIDTLISDRIDNSMRTILKTTLESMLQLVSFPSAPMKIGDTFEQVIPMTIPMAGIQPIKIIISTNYTLREIRAKIAYFDITQSATMDMTMGQDNIKASGGGTGKVEFSMIDNMITNVQTDLLLDMTINIEDLILTAKINSTTRQIIQLN